MNQRFRVDLRGRISLGADRFSTFRRSEPAGSLDRVINRKGPFKRRENGGTKRTKNERAVCQGQRWRPRPTATRRGSRLPYDTERDSDGRAMPSF